MALVIFAFVFDARHDDGGPLVSGNQDRVLYSKGAAAFGHHRLKRPGENGSRARERDVTIARGQPLHYLRVLQRQKPLGVRG